MNIQEIQQKINSWLSDGQLFMALLLVLVAVASFGLGQRSVPAKERKLVPVTQSVAQSVSTESPSSTIESVSYVGSKNSDKYHLPWCPGAQKIAEQNKVYFNSQAAATAAGYKPAGNCPGL